MTWRGHTRKKFTFETPETKIFSVNFCIAAKIVLYMYSSLCAKNRSESDKIETAFWKGACVKIRIPFQAAYTSLQPKTQQTEKSS